MSDSNSTSPQIPHQPPAAVHRLQSIQAAAESKMMELAKAIRERTFLLQTTQVHVKTIIPQRPRQFDILAFRATGLKTIDHEKDRAREVEPGR